MDDWQRKEVRKATGVHLMATIAGGVPHVSLPEQTQMQALNDPKLSRVVYDEIGRLMWANRQIKDR